MSHDPHRPPTASRGRAYVGCSGWNYPHWRGAVYPADLVARHWFGWYADHLDTVSSNTTFYRLPTIETARGWARQAPPGFVYAVKLGQYASHRKKLSDPQQWLANHLDRLDALGHSGGPTLVQLPPHWRRNLARLRRVPGRLPAGPADCLMVRDPSWMHDDTLSVLAAHGAALCIHDLLDAQSFHHPFTLTTGSTYLRFHGPDAPRRPYQGRYTGRRLRPLADRLSDLLGDGVDVYAYFNNDDSGYAFRCHLAARPPPVIEAGNAHDTERLPRSCATASGIGSAPPHHGSGALTRSTEWLASRLERLQRVSTELASAQTGARSSAWW